MTLKLKSSKNKYVKNITEKSITYTDEFNIKECETFEEGVQEIDEYMYYHNNYRGQWNLKI